MGARGRAAGASIGSARTSGRQGGSGLRSSARSTEDGRLVPTRTPTVCHITRLATVDPSRMLVEGSTLDAGREGRYPAAMGHPVAGSVSGHEQVPWLVVGHSTQARTEPQGFHVVVPHRNPIAGRQQDLPASAPAMHRVTRPTRMVARRNQSTSGAFALSLFLS